MAEILENIGICILLGMLFFMFVTLFWYVVITPITDHIIKRKTNKIQWKCEKVEDKLNCNTYDLYYRTLPSELSKFVKIFGKNDWIPVRKFSETVFISKYGFIEFVKPYETRKDIENFINGESGWIYP